MKERDLKIICREVRSGGERLTLLTSDRKQKALLAMARALKAHSNLLIRENQKDVLRVRVKDMSTSLIARLVLDKAKIEKMAHSIASIAKLTDPVGRVISSVRRD